MYSSYACLDMLKVNREISLAGLCLANNDC